MNTNSTNLTAGAPAMTLRIVPRRANAKVQEIRIETLNQASAIVDRLRLEKGWRSSTMPQCLIVVDGEARGYVSLNGRVWAGTPNAAERRELVFSPEGRRDLF